MLVSGAVRLPPVPLATYFSVNATATGALALPALFGETLTDAV